MIIIYCHKQDSFGAVRVMLDNHSGVSRSRKDQQIHMSHVGIGGVQKQFVIISLSLTLQCADRGHSKICER